MGITSSAIFFWPFFRAASGRDDETVVVGCTVGATEDEGAGPDAVGVVVVSFFTKTVTRPAPKTNTIIIARNLCEPLRTAPLDHNGVILLKPSGKDGQR